ncbi:jg21840 [Pararge aegeria aegeria]|uniref:Jg21840 protein n=1 Tax=Pararge aegeria aegeria TaxID=348720 RepID=A0A8S4QII0_9NEOP|nr:jg21840 [Pararge aegeria aegeria]
MLVGQQPAHSNEFGSPPHWRSESQTRVGPGGVSYARAAGKEPQPYRPESCVRANGAHKATASVISPLLAVSVPRREIKRAAETRAF